MEGLLSLVHEDIAELRKGNVKPSFGDTRCIAYGHLVRLAIWNLKTTWNKKAKTSEKIATISDWLRDFGGWAEVEKYLHETKASRGHEPLGAVCESTGKYGVEYEDISF